MRFEALRGPNLRRVLAQTRGVVQRKALPGRTLESFSLMNTEIEDHGCNQGCRRKVHIVRTTEAIFAGDGRTFRCRRVIIERVVRCDERQLIQPAERRIQYVNRCPGEKHQDHGRGDTPDDCEHRPLGYHSRFAAPQNRRPSRSPPAVTTGEPSRSGSKVFSAS